MNTMLVGLWKFLRFTIIYYACLVFTIYLVPQDENSMIFPLVSLFYFLMLDFGLYFVPFIYGLNFQFINNPNQLQIHLLSFILFILSFLAMSVWYPPHESFAFASRYYKGNIDIVTRLSLLQTLSFYLGSQIVFLTKYILAISTKK